MSESGRKTRHIGTKFVLKTFDEYLNGLTPSKRQLVDRYFFEGLEFDLKAGRIYDPEAKSAKKKSKGKKKNDSPCHRLDKIQKLRMDRLTRRANITCKKDVDNFFRYEIMKLEFD